MPDASTKAIIAGNVITMLFAVILGFSLGEIVWIYWIESVIIGGFTVLRMLVAGKRGGQMAKVLSFASFFCFHYGLFHFGYFIFLLVLPWFSLDLLAAIYVLGAGAVFLSSHAFSFYNNVIVNKETIYLGKDGIKNMFAIPYARIFPLHLTIIASGFIMVLTDFGDYLPIVLLFMVLKSIADVVSHKMEHNEYKKMRI